MNHEQSIDQTEDTTTYHREEKKKSTKRS